MVDKLDKRQRAYVEARSKGVSQRGASAIAGFSEGNGGKVEAAYDVQTELARIRADAAKNAGVTRDDVINGFKRAAEMAGVLDDVAGMVAAWREMGKLLGFYAPEVKKIEKGINKGDLMKAMDALSDEELLRLSRGRVIDGESSRVRDDGTPEVPAVLP
jgi:hypothetical protein